MSTVIAYLQLGIHHVLSPDAMDHVLFLLALAAVYRLAEWREAVWVVTAFTAGHSLTLALTVLGVVAPPSAWIEFLIPATILATCLANLLLATGDLDPRQARRRAGLAVLFGLVHGAGFAGYLSRLLLDEVAWPLLGFNLGIELGQVAVLFGAGLLFAAVDRLLGARLRLRAAAVSALVGAAALRLSVARWP
jgi:hypothetical protein